MTIFDIVHLVVDGPVPADSTLAQRHHRPITSRKVLRRFREYRAAFPWTGISCAASSLRQPQVATAVRRRGHSIDVQSCEQLASVLAAGIPAVRIVMHDDGVTAAPIRRAVNAGVGRLIIACHRQVGVLVACSARHPRLMVDATSDCADDAIAALLARPQLNLIGLHTRLTPEAGASAYGDAIEYMVARMARVRWEHGIVLTRVSLAGGPILSDATSSRLVLRGLAAELEDAFDAACARYRFPRPALTLAPR